MNDRAVVVGSGPNGLAAAIVLAQAGLPVDVYEAASEPGGGARTGALTLPGFMHDLGSAVHPLAVSSPFFSSLPLAKHGLRWIWPNAALAHPFDDGSALTLERTIKDTGLQLGVDAAAWRRIYQPLVDNWEALVRDVFRPIIFPHHPLLLARFGVRASQPASALAQWSFRNEKTKTFFAGLAAHSALDLRYPLSAAFGLVLGAAGHAVGWPIPAGGAGAITKALVGVLTSLGGRVLTNHRVTSLQPFTGAPLILCDVTPRQFVDIAGDRLCNPFRRSLRSYRYGPGIFKVDWALHHPIPWKATECLRAATVHLGGSLAEIVASERAATRGETCERPYVLLSQPTLFDPSRAPEGKSIAWAYCHVPNGSRISALDAIENQIERFAPGFRDCIMARAVWSPQAMEDWNNNLVGGDVVGGSLGGTQFLLRPTWRRYGTPLKNVFLCSASTPPGGAVHGLCGYYGAHAALRSLRHRQAH